MYWRGNAYYCVLGVSRRLFYSSVGCSPEELPAIIRLPPGFITQQPPNYASDIIL